MVSDVMEDSLKTDVLGFGIRVSPSHVVLFIFKQPCRLGLGLGLLLQENEQIKTV